MLGLKIVVCVVAIESRVLVAALGRSIKSSQALYQISGASSAKKSGTAELGTEPT
jgi:hypothetical protein